MAQVESDMEEIIILYMYVYEKQRSKRKRRVSVHEIFTCFLSCPLSCPFFSKLHKQKRLTLVRRCLYLLNWRKESRCWLVDSKTSARTNICSRSHSIWTVPLHILIYSRTKNRVRFCDRALYNRTSTRAFLMRWYNVVKNWMQGLPTTRRKLYHKSTSTKKYFSSTKVVVNRTETNQNIIIVYPPLQFHVIHILFTNTANNERS